MSFLSTIDIFGTEFSFTTFGSSKYGTIMGGMLTIICGFVFIAFTVLFGRDFFWRENPKLLTQTIFPELYPPPIKLNQSTLIIPWRFENVDGNPINMTGKLYSSF